LTQDTSFFTQKFNNIEIKLEQLRSTIDNCQFGLIDNQQWGSKLKHEMMDLINRQNLEMKDRVSSLNVHLEQTST